MTTYQERSSVSTVKKSCGSYQFRIEGFSTVPNRIGESIESPEFTLCSHIWQLRIFPGGSLEQHKGFLSFYLASKSTKMARANYTLSIVNQIIDGEDESFASTAIRVFEPKGDQVDGWGRDRFIPVEMLNNPEYGLILNDSVVFKADITVYGELEVLRRYDGGTFSGVQGILSLERSIALSFNDCSSADVIFEFEGEAQQLFCHRFMLSIRSRVFRAMFTSQMTESNSGKVLITDTTAAVMEKLLLYIYTDFIPDKKFLTLHGLELLRIAKKYDIEGLAMECEDFLCDYVQISSVYPLIRFSENHSCSRLKQKCLHFIAENSEKSAKFIHDVPLEDELLQEIQSTVEAFKKRSYCKRKFEQASKYHVSCNIM